MCYPKPGPRCTPHAKSRLQNAIVHYQEAIDKKVPSNVLEQKKLQVLYAKRAFEATPGGIKEIEADLNNEVDELKKQKLQKRLERAVQTRNDQMEAYKAMISDKNDNISSQKVYLDNIAPESEFEEAMLNKYIRKQVHPDPNVPYDIYDYTENATFDRVWNTVTMSSRGLIINRETGEVVARPFPKFFNDGEIAPGYNDFPREGKVEVYDKVDGSCGICYRLPNGKLAISTRGSMGSDQAKHATEILNSKYPDFNPDDKTTYMFEIIYPENRIVVSYGDMDDLVLLGGVDKKTGKSVPLEKLQKGWSGPVADKYEYTSYAEALSSPIPSDKEGYVIHFTDVDKRVKLKGEDYLRLHRVITNATPRRVWELISSGQDIDEWLKSGVPDEFADWAKAEASKQRNQYNEISQKIEKEHSRVKAELEEAHPDGYTQKDYAVWVNKNVEKKYISFMFSLQQGRSLSDSKTSENIWKMIRPEHEKAVF